LFAYKVNTGISMESNILALLPATEADPAVEKAFDIFSDQIGKKVVFLVGNNNITTARQAANQFYHKLIPTKIFNKINYRLDEAEQQRVFSRYFPYRQMLLSNRQQQQFEQGQFQEIIKNALVRLYSPMALTNSSLLEQDPLFLFSDYVTEMSASIGTLNMDDGVISVTKDGISYFLISAQLDFDPFSAQGQSLFAKFYTEAKNSVKQQYPSVAILTAGVIHHAIAGTNSAKQQISTIGIGSLLGILLLIFLAFRTLQPLWFSLFPIAVGLLAGLLACLFVFEQVHLITLVFGASLIGVSIDYCFHYFAEQYEGGNNWKARKGLQRIFGGITLGLITSLIGYAALFIAPFPGLRQIAVFSSVGLLASYLSVVCWFPYWLSPSDKKILPVFKTLAATMISLWDSRRISLLGLTLFIIVLATGLLNMQVNDDIRILQNSPTELIEQEKQIKEIFQLNSGNQFFLIKADTAQGVLEKEEKLGRLLQQKIKEGVLSSYQAISQVLPSAANQQRNYLLTRQAFLQHKPILVQYFRDIGFDDTVSKQYLDKFKPLSAPFISIDIEMKSPALDSLRFLWLGQLDDSYVSMVALGNVKNIQSLELLEQDIQGISFIDRVDDISQLLKRYRQEASHLVIAAYLLIFLLLIIRYQFQKACLVILPPLLAAGFALAVSAWLGISLNLFNTLALLLVLGIGIDYTLFFAEMPQHRQTTMLAIMLSAITTILSFGLLALSHTPVIHSFGMMVLVGISMAFLLAPLRTKFGEV
jgi:predicted exporter